MHFCPKDQQLCGQRVTVNNMALFNVTNGHSKHNFHYIHDNESLLPHTCIVSLHVWNLIFYNILLANTSTCHPCKITACNPQGHKSGRLTPCHMNHSRTASPQQRYAFGLCTVSECRFGLSWLQRLQMPVGRKSHSETLHTKPINTPVIVSALHKSHIQWNRARKFSCQARRFHQPLAQ